ncbi:MAG: hypothetical protein JWO61_90 [Candidatus Saccharibacteria bacterium]|nr:hypothetical protein [Candidatus Saccharibacteria bacterium]
MSLAEQLSFDETQPQIPSAARELAHNAYLALSIADTGQFHYRPDFMSEPFAHEIAFELEGLGVDAFVVATWLKGIRSKQGSSFALELSHQKETNVIPFPQHT